MNLADFIDDKWRWSLATFGPGPRVKGLTDHIRKELLEIEAHPTDPEEWVDVILLAIDGLSRLGLKGPKIVAAIEHKQWVNEHRRNWPKTTSPDHPAEHVK